jgi:hypothetical protein
LDIADINGWFSDEPENVYLDFWYANILTLAICGYQLVSAMFALTSIKMEFLLSFHKRQ